MSLDEVHPASILKSTKRVATRYAPARVNFHLLTLDLGPTASAYRRTSPHQLTAKMKLRAIKAINTPYVCWSAYSLSKFWPRRFPRGAFVGSKLCGCGMVRPL